MTINTLHILYTKYAGNPIRISLLSQGEFTDLRRRIPNDPQMQLIVIHVDGTQTKEPTLHILALTDQQGGEEFNDTVEWDVIKWLVDKGHMVKR